MTRMPTAEEAEDIRQRYAVYSAERDLRFGRQQGLTEEELATIAPCPSIPELGQLELYEFMTEIPERLVGYARPCPRKEDFHLTCQAMSWGGVALGTLLVGRSYKAPAFWRHSVRRQVTLLGFNGYLYHGVFFESSGDYIRLKRGKRQPIDQGLIPLEAFMPGFSLTKNIVTMGLPRLLERFCRSRSIQVAQHLMCLDPLTLYQNGVLTLCRIGELRKALRRLGLDFRRWLVLTDDIRAGLAEFDLLREKSA